MSKVGFLRNFNALILAFLAGCTSSFNENAPIEHDADFDNDQETQRGIDPNGGSMASDGATGADTNGYVDSSSDDSDIGVDDSDIGIDDSGISGDSDQRLDGELEPNDPPDGTTCLEALLCIQQCGGDMVCNLDCVDAVCDSSREPLGSVMACALAECSSECLDYGSTGCVTCMGLRCPSEGLQCGMAECANTHAVNI